MPLTGEDAVTDQRVRGFGHMAERGFTAAFELVVTPVLFGFIGHAIDGRLGTGRLFTIALSVVVTVYVVWKLCYNYLAEMKALEAERLERRARPSSRAESR
jgi:hypothetical protein